MGIIKTLHVIGFKNSGKTTLINRWIKLLKKNGYTVAVIKHHGHGATLAMPDEKKDSMQYLHSGADISLVAGGGQTQHILNKEASFIQLKELALMNKPDVILIEGYKKEQGEKVVLISDEADWNELKGTSNIRLVVGLQSACAHQQIDSREATEQLDNWLLQWVRD